MAPYEATMRKANNDFMLAMWPYMTDQQKAAGTLALGSLPDPAGDYERWKQLTSPRDDSPPA